VFTVDVSVCWLIILLFDLFLICDVGSHIVASISEMPCPRACRCNEKAWMRVLLSEISVFWFQ
jgi:hypothetical protein